MATAPREGRRPCWHKAAKEGLARRGDRRAVGALSERPAHGMRGRSGRVATQMACRSPKNRAAVHARFSMQFQSVLADSEGRFPKSRCTAAPTALDYVYRQSPSLVKGERAARLYWNGSGCRQARCLSTCYRFKTPYSRVLSECLYFRLRFSLSQTSNTSSNLQPSRIDANKFFGQISVAEPCAIVFDVPPCLYDGWAFLLSCPMGILGFCQNELCNVVACETRLRQKFELMFARSVCSKLDARLFFLTSKTMTDRVG